jgi:hypothetical protein
MSKVEEAQMDYRWIGVGSAFVAGVAASLLAVGPDANAVTAIVPVLPDVGDNQPTPTGALGMPPFYDGYTWEQDATYTDAIAGPVDTSYGPPEPVWNTITIGPDFTSTEFKDFNGHLATLPDGDIVHGATFDHISTGALGLDNYLVATPVLETNGSIMENINDTFVFDPGGLGFNADGVVSGIQLLDLPDATAPVDELNVLGEGATILFTIPLGGLDFFNFF